MEFPVGPPRAIATKYSDRPPSGPMTITLRRTGHESARQPKVTGSQTTGSCVPGRLSRVSERAWPYGRWQAAPLVNARLSRCNSFRRT